MSKLIKYISGQELGPHGIIYIKDVEWYIQPSGKKIRQAEFECPHCEERKHFIARIANIKNGHTKSCGCLNDKSRVERITKYNEEGHDPWNKIKYKEGDIIGDYGIIYLAETEEDNRSPQGQAYRKCIFRCPICGDPFISDINNVRQNKTKSCGEHGSLGEEKIKKILKENNINYEAQKTFNDLKSEKGWPFKFDFYLPEYNCCIEYDGEQHFNARKQGFFTKDRVKEIQYNDELKNSYCKNNNIKLIRIPYTDYNILDWNFLKERIEI